MNYFKLAFVIVVSLGFLSSCAKEEPITTISTENISCVAGFVENKPGYGTLDIYTSSGSVNEVTHIEDVSIETAKEITEDMGEC